MTEDLNALIPPFLVRRTIMIPKRPTGHITVDGEAMAFWLPPGVTAHDIGLTCIEQEG